ncbi:MAG: ABC transporter substrate-binding protein [Spirochaetia bacterium]
MKKLLSVLTILLLASAVFAGGEQEKTEGPMTQGEDRTFVYESIGDPDSLDPAKAYDSASWEVMANIYETLIAYDGESTSEFVPVIAEVVPSIENGGISEDAKTYRFKIRDGIFFHNGSPVTPEDVEYTFERNMVVDADGGPNWVWYSYFLGTGGSRDGDGNFAVTFDQIDKAVEVDGDYVVFNLAAPFPPFLSLVAATWGSILDKDWVIEQGGWDGTEATWKDYNKPDEMEETLYDIANGTGPYMLERWEKDVEVVLTRNDNYWGEKPYFERGIARKVTEWGTRKLALLQGDADSVYVPAQYYNEMMEEDGVYDIDTAQLSVTAFHFNYEINTTDNPMAGSGQLDGQGVPSDFFKDDDVRKGFAYAWDGETFRQDVLLGYAKDPVTPVPFGLPYKDTSLEGYDLNLEKAKEHFQNAYDGELWEKGFKLEILYNEGNEGRQTTARILAENITSLNSKFQIETRAISWAEYLDKIRNSTMPLFIIGWLPDYPDPDNFVTPFMHSVKGTFAAWANYENPVVDELIDKAATTVDPDKRQEMYYALQQIYVEDVVSVVTNQPEEKWFFNDNIEGVYFNPMMSSQFDLLPYLKRAK